MADILIQFHALREELLPLLEQSVAEFDLNTVAIKYFPFTTVLVLPGRLKDVLSNEGQVREIALTVTPPILGATTGGKFWDQNPDQLQLQFGELTEKGLRQSSLSARTSNLEALTMWRKIAKRLKDITKAGVVVINPDTGASVRDRTFRYTHGAKRLEMEGVRMLPVAGGNIVKLGDGAA